MKTIIFSLVFLLFYVNSQAQYTLTDSNTVDALIDELKGSGIEILNAELRCGSPVKNGIFSGSGLLGMDEGIVLSTSRTNMIFVEYDDSNRLGPWLDYSGHISFEFPTADSTYFQKIIGVWMDTITTTDNYRFYNTCILAMDVVPANDNIKVDYILGDGVGNPFAHAYLGFYYGTYTCKRHPLSNPIGVFISGGAEYPDTVNLAIYPQVEVGDTPVDVNRYTLRVTQEFLDSFSYMGGAGGIYKPSWWHVPYDAYLVANDSGYFASHINYATLSTPMQAVATVTPCDTYQLALGVSAFFPKWDCGIGHYNFTTSIFLDNLRSEGPNAYCDSTMGIKSIQQELPLDIAPNPFVANLRLIAERGLGHQTLHCEVTNVVGEKLMVSDGDITAINTSLGKMSMDLPSGIYLISVVGNNDGRSKVFKVVKR